jgi:hypothetical protein
MINNVAKASRIFYVYLCLSSGFEITKDEEIYAELKYKIEKIVQLIVIFINSSLMFS